jgi:heterodisulfide reductase subunit A2
VHSGAPDQATEKAIDLVRMAVGRTARLTPLQQEMVSVNNAALVIGGGVAGMTAALTLADQGFPVHLVEKDTQLGGTARQLHHTLDGRDIQAFLAEAISHVSNHPRITVYLGSRAGKVEGHIGNFRSTISGESGPIEVQHGAIVVATGATEEKPRSFGYGQNPRVITQLELTDRLGRGEISLPENATVAMIQCVEQRNTERPYCSRVCCTSAVKNSLELKKRYPQAKIIVLYRDMRTYGFREAAYREAREKGVLFVRYEPEQPPELALNGGLKLNVRELSLGRDLNLEPDLVVLAAPMIPRADRTELSELLRVPLNADGFFLEAHMKLRPVDFASEGLFLCGTAHAPKFLTETIAQASAVAGRAASILSKKKMPVGGQIAWVDPDKCISCMTCVHVCPYMAPAINEFNKAEVQGATCMGCGSCSAECPSKAITLRHFYDSQILAAIDGALGIGAEEKMPELVYPAQAGVAPPRWHLTQLE